MSNTRADGWQTNAQPSDGWEWDLHRAERDGSAGISDNSVGTGLDEVKETRVLMLSSTFKFNHCKNFPKQVVHKLREYKYTSLKWDHAF